MGKNISCTIREYGRFKKASNMANYSNNRLEMKNIGKERDLFVSAKDIDEINNGSKQDEVLEFNLSKVVDIDDDYKWVSSTRICDDSVDFLGYRDKILSEEVLIKLSNIFNDREITYIYSQEFEGCEASIHIQKYLNGKQL